MSVSVGVGRREESMETFHRHLSYSGRFHPSLKESCLSLHLIFLYVNKVHLESVYSLSF